MPKTQQKLNELTGNKEIWFWLVLFVVVLFAAMWFLMGRPVAQKIKIVPSQLSPSVSLEQARITICTTAKGALFDEACQNKFDTVSKNDRKKIGELFFVLKKIENDRSISDYERILLGQVVFAALPKKDSPLSLRPDFLAFLSASVAHAQENTLSPEEFKALMASDLKNVLSLPEGDNAWVINIAVSKYSWVNGERQPLYSEVHAVSFNPYPGSTLDTTVTPYPGATIESKAEWEQYKSTHIQSVVGSHATNQSLSDGASVGNTSEMIAYAFMMESWKSEPYGSDSVLVVAEAGPEEKYMKSEYHYTEAGYQGDNFLSNLLADVPMPLREQTTANEQQEEAKPSKSSRTVPPPGTPISKKDYSHIIGQPGCEPWAAYAETGVYCFTEEEMNAVIASGDLGQIRNKPPTYPFYDGNEPWKAPINYNTAVPQPDEGIEYESEAPVYVPQESGASNSGSPWTESR